MENGAQRIVVGNLVINLEVEEVTLSQKPVHLSPTEYKILAYIALNSRERPVPKAQLDEHFYPDGHASINSDPVTVFISNIRRKLRCMTENRHCYIINGRAAGYQLSTGA